MKKTKKEYEKLLNKLEPDSDTVFCQTGGKRIKRFGSWLRKNDPMQFDVGFNEWEREKG